MGIRKASRPGITTVDQLDALQEFGILKITNILIEMHDTIQIQKDFFFIKVSLHRTAQKKKKQERLNVNSTAESEL